VNTVLVIGEGPEQARALSERLGLSGVDALPSVREWKLAVRSLTSYRVDAVLIDISPGAESREFFQLMAELTDVPIVVRASEPNADEAVWYLDHGAADYLPQLMSAGVLAAKVKSLSRTVAANAERVPLVCGNIEIDLEERRVSRDGQEIALTPLEFRLLSALAENAGKPLKRRALLERVWGEDFQECSHYLRLYIGYLRQKLEADPRRPKIILTEWGHGYRLATNVPATEPARKHAWRPA
jgi:two-component system KDP operon response regulator KdpE